MVRSGGPLMIVLSVAVSLVVSNSPPPETVALLTRGVVASGATLTVTLMGKKLPFTGREPALVQVRVASVQTQLKPLMAVAVMPAGSVSVTVTVPLVAPPPL